MENLKKILDTEKKKTFLDIGTGAGNFIQIIKSMYSEYDHIIGIDTFERAIDAANKNNDDEKITFEVMDAYEMSYPDEAFDVVTLSNSLHHLKDIPSLFQEMGRVLKKDGFIIINEMMADNLDKMQESHKLVHHYSAKIDREHGDIHNDTFTEKEIITLLEDNTKLKVDKSWHIEVPRRTENSQEELDYIYNILDRISSRAPKDKVQMYESEKEEIKTYIKHNGYDGCTSLLAILKK